MHHHDEHARSERQPTPSRAGTGRVAGLDWTATYVLKAAGDVAMALWDRRLTLDQVEERLAAATRISRKKIEASLGPLADQGYLTADDAPGNPEIVLQLLPKGLDAYCCHLVPSFGRIQREILLQACQDVRIDVCEIARRMEQADLLVEHVLREAERHGDLRLGGTGHYIVVEEVSSQLRRWVSGAA